MHLELPEDIAQEQTDEQVFPASLVRRPTVEDKAVRGAVELIETARHPLLVIGAAANRKLTSRMLRRLVDKTGIPFISTQMGKGVLDEHDEHFLGNAALSDNDFIHRAVDHSDLIINIGHDVVEKPPFVMKPGGRKVIHINFFSAQVDPVYFPQIELVGDIANSIWQISERLKPTSNWDFEFFAKVRAAAEAHIQRDAEDPRFPIYPQRLVADVRKVMPPEGIIALDNGVYKIWFARNYKAYQTNTVLLDNALASMGAGLPSAMAAKLVCPDRPVMAICGDGGFMMNSQELETAVRLKMNLTVLILRDNALGMIKWKQEHMGFESFGLDYDNPDFVQYAQSYGGQGHRVSSTEELLPTMQRCLDSEGVHLIDAPVDYSDNVRVLNQEIQQLSHTI